MPLDPGVRFLLDALEQLDRPLMSSGTPEQARASFRRLTVEIRQPSMIIPVAAVEDLEIPGPAGRIPARVYRPSGDEPLPTVVFYHGGGFVIGDLDTHDNQARRLCRDANVVVVSIDYRRAPEHPWPAGVDDAFAAIRWVGDHIDRFGGDPDRLAVAGDSAGGNFSAVVAQMCRDAGGPALRAQLLIYPAVDFAAGGETYPSREQHADGYFLTRDDMMWFASHYVESAVDEHGWGEAVDGGSPDPELLARLSDPRISPIRGHLSGLPPALVVTAEFDPLVDEGEAYAEALAEAGVPVTAIRFDGLIHGFFDMAALSPACADAADRTCREFARLLR